MPPQTFTEKSVIEDYITEKLKESSLPYLMAEYFRTGNVSNLGDNFNKDGENIKIKRRKRNIYICNVNIINSLSPRCDLPSGGERRVSSHLFLINKLIYGLFLYNLEF